MNTKELSVTDAVKTFSSEMGTPVRALNSVNLTIPTGSHVAIMGPSGSGKSTLLHCMSGILPLDAGTVMFAGTNLAALREKQRSKIRREHMGFVFQDGALLPELTNEENVAMPLLLAGMSLPCRTPASGWCVWGWRMRLDVAPDRFRVAKPSEWRLPAPWWPAPPSSLLMSPPAPWTKTRARR